MKKTKFRLFILLAIFSLLLIYNQIILAGQINTLDLGSITAPDKYFREFFLKIDNNIEKIDIWVEGNFYNAEGNLVIPSQRLTLKLANSDLMLSKNAISLSKSELISHNEKIVIPFQLKILPEDSPGKYISSLYIKTYNGEEKIIETRLDFVVNSWTRIRYSRQQNLLINSSDFTSRNITSGIIPYLEVASNTDWKLSGRLNKNLDLKINLEPQKNLNIENINGVFLQESPVLLVKGNKTVSNDKYWESIPFKLYFVDFTKLPAGRMEFPVIFSLRPVE